VSTADGKF
jgi:heat shock protein 90kDa beta